MLRIETKNIDKGDWLRLIERSNVASFFQTPECYTFYSSLSFLEPFIFGVYEDKYLCGLMCGYITSDGHNWKSFFSRRAIVLGGVLIANDIKYNALHFLLSYSREFLAKKSIFIEIRNFKDYSQYKSIFQAERYVYCPHFDFHIDTTSIDIIKEHLGKSRKRDIKLSIRNGAYLIESPSIDQIKDWYGILMHLYQSKVRTPLFPFEFFEKLYKSNFAVYCLIGYENKVIGGSLNVCFKNEILYEWYVCGDKNVGKYMYSSTLATYFGIISANKCNCQVFDMMGAGKPKDNYGVRDFKAKFGGNLRELGRFMCIENKFLYFIGKIGVFLIKKL